jgi:hypothetical protein
MNKHLLRAEMIKFGDTGRELANALGIARTTLSAKMSENNDAEFTQGEIAIIKDRYSLSAKDIYSIFFSAKVS